MSKQITLIETETEDGVIIKRYECDFIAECDGSSIWGDTTNKKVHVTGITVIEEEFEDFKWTQVNVEHDSEWEIYTDRGFEAAISEAVGFAVTFTEQGMQEDNMASMEC